MGVWGNTCCYLGSHKGQNISSECIDVMILTSGSLEDACGTFFFNFDNVQHMFNSAKMSLVHLLFWYAISVFTQATEVQHMLDISKS